MARRKVEELIEFINVYTKLLKLISSIDNNTEFMYFIIQFAQYLLAKYYKAIPKGDTDEIEYGSTGAVVVGDISKSILLEEICSLRNAICHMSKIGDVYYFYNDVLKYLNEDIKYLNDDIANHCFCVMRKYLSSLNNRNALLIYLNEIAGKEIAILETEDEQNNESILNKEISSF